METTRYTFGLSHAYANRFIEVVHPSHINARAVMHKAFGKSWSSEYLEGHSDWSAIREKYNYKLLLRVRVDAAGNEVYDDDPDA